MPAALPDNWTGGFVLLTLVFVLSSFLDNIAGALIGATVASHVFKGRVRVGYLAAIVAAANAGGAGSVIGDTTTTMLWIAGVSPLSVLDAYVAATCALFVSGIPASLAQHKYAPIVKDPPSGLRISFIDRSRTAGRGHVRRRWPPPCRQGPHHRWCRGSAAWRE